MHTSKNSIIGFALARFFCGLMIGSDVGINAKWIATGTNKIADAISRLKKSHTSTSFCYDFSKLKQDHADLKHCRFYHPSQEQEVRSPYRIFLRSKRLGQSDSQPMGVYENHQGLVKYLTGNKISELLQADAKKCHPDLTKDEISHFSSHSGRVWAVVLLDEAGMNPDFIKSRLRWMGESYRLYLRDTAILQQKHITALEQSSFDFISLYGDNRTALPDIVPEDTSTGAF